MRMPMKSLMLVPLAAALVVPQASALAEPHAADIHPTIWSGERPWMAEPLTADQDMLWQEIRAARAANLEQLQRIVRQAQSALTEELDREQPDLFAVAMQTEAAMDQLIGDVRENRDRRLALYAQLDPAQQAQAEKRLQRGLARVERALSFLAMFAGDGPRSVLEFDDH